MKKSAALTFTLALLSPLGAGATPLFKELADGVYMFSENRYTSLVVVGDDGVLVTDPAWSARAESLQDAIAGVTDKPVTAIVLSHEHYDHVGGTGVFPGARVICHRSCQAVFALDPSGIAPTATDVTFGDFLGFDFGGKTVHLYHYGPADGFATTLLHLPDERIAFTADLYKKRRLIPARWTEDVNYLGILRALRELKSKNPVHAVESHSTSTALEDAEEYLEFVEDLYDMVFAEIQKAARAGGPGAVVQGMPRWESELEMPKYADWEGYDEYLPAHIRRMALSIFHGG